MKLIPPHVTFNSKLQLSKLILILGMLAFLSTAQVAVADDTDGKIHFHNKYGAAIEVKIYHVSLDNSTAPITIEFGKKQKGATINNDAGKTFTFRAGTNCKNKKRGFKVFKATSGEFISQGMFSFKAESSSAGRSESCKQKVQPPIYDSNVVSYEKVKSYKGKFTVLVSN